MIGAYTIYTVGWGLLLGGFVAACLLWAWVGHVLTLRVQRERREVQREHRRVASHARYYP